jgi:nucleotide-binding universal stress UspA family protein
VGRGIRGIGTRIAEGDVVGFLRLASLPPLEVDDAALTRLEHATAILRRDGGTGLFVWVAVGTPTSLATVALSESTPLVIEYDSAATYEPDRAAVKRLLSRARGTTGEWIIGRLADRGR